MAQPNHRQVNEDLHGIGLEFLREGDHGRAEAKAVDRNEDRDSRLEDPFRDPIHQHDGKYRGNKRGQSEQALFDSNFEQQSGKPHVADGPK